MERAKQKREKTQEHVTSLSDNRKVAVIILMDTSGLFFVHQRRLDHDDDAGKYGLGAGGWFDLDEVIKDKAKVTTQELEDAATHKLKEETGITAAPKFIFWFNFPKKTEMHQVFVFEDVVDHVHVMNPKRWVKRDWLPRGGVDALRDELCPDALVSWEHYKTDMLTRNLRISSEELINDLTTDHPRQPGEYAVQEARGNVSAYSRPSEIETPAKPFEGEQERLSQVVLCLSEAMKDISEKDQQLWTLKTKGWSYQQIMQELDMSESEIRRRLQRIGERWKRSIEGK